MPADKQPHDANDKSDFIPYPTDRVVGIIDDAGDVQGALCDLKSAGFGPDDIRLLTGEAGARRIDIKGDEHGPLAHVVRSVQEVLGSYEIEHLTRYEQELLAGHFGIGVIAHDVQGQDKVRQILKAHHGHFINYYSRWVVEYLEP